MSCARTSPLPPSRDLVPRPCQHALTLGTTAAVGAVTELPRINHATAA